MDRDHHIPRHANLLRIVAMGGSLRRDSCSYLALDHAMRILARMGCSTRILDLRTMALPFCEGDNNDIFVGYPGVARMRAAIARAHAIVLATPEYHGSLSGVLKNALDLLSREQLEGKLAGVISVLGGPATTNALNDVSRILRSCHAWVLPQQIAVGHASKAFVAGLLEDPTLQTRFEEFATALVAGAVRINNFDQSAVTQEPFHENRTTRSRNPSRIRRRSGDRRTDERSAATRLATSIVQYHPAGKTWQS